jgi:hypothetical protein
VPEIPEEQQCRNFPKSNIKNGREISWIYIA